MNKTSLDAYDENKVHLSQKEKEVFQVLFKYYQLTSFDIAYYLQWNINRVTGRVNSLLHKQMIMPVSKIDNRTVYRIRNEDDPLNVFDQSWEEKFHDLEKKYNELKKLVETLKPEKKQLTLFPTS